MHQTQRQGPTAKAAASSIAFDGRRAGARAGEGGAIVREHGLEASGQLCVLYGLLRASSESVFRSDAEAGLSTAAMC